MNGNPEAWGQCKGHLEELWGYQSINMALTYFFWGLIVRGGELWLEDLGKLTKATFVGSGESQFPDSGGLLIAPTMYLLVF